MVYSNLTASGNTPTLCPTCNGTGTRWIVDINHIETAARQIATICPTCNGTRYIDSPAHDYGKDTYWDAVTEKLTYINNRYSEIDMMITQKIDEALRKHRDNRYVQTEKFFVLSGDVLELNVNLVIDENSGQYLSRGSRLKVIGDNKVFYDNFDCIPEKIMVWDENTEQYEETENLLKDVWCIGIKYCKPIEYQGYCYFSSLTTSE